MTRTSIIVFAFSVVSIIGVSVLAQTRRDPTAVTAQQNQTCASSPRRAEAVQLARGINTAEAMARSKNEPYQPMDALNGITVPDGFAVQLVTNDTGYIFTVKDEQDACGFGLFSDQKGVIYLGETMK